MASDVSAIEIVGHRGGIELTVKVVPGASRTKVVGVWGSALKIAIAAPPEGGKANAAVTKLLAAVFGVRKADVSILSGHTTPLKRIGLAGITVAAARAHLAKS